MKKILGLFLIALIFSGCATYKFQKAPKDPSGGYLVSYEGKSIPEYTVGKDNSLPDLALAKQRFKRRKSVVEYYYKKMDLIESKVRQDFIEMPSMLLDFVGGLLRWPFTAVADYRYNHNPKYREKIDRLEEEKEELEKAKINSLKEKLKEYVTKDLAKENPQVNVQPQIKSTEETQIPEKTVDIEAKQPAQEPQSEQQELPAEENKQSPVEPAITPEPVVTFPAQEETQEIKQIDTAQPEIKPAVLPPEAKNEPPVAIISANPLKGYSPLTVKFSAKKSHAKSGKIVSYFWDFGDSDTSTKPNPTNTFWSTSYGVRAYTVTLTVKDQTGASSSASQVISVSSK